MWPRYTPTTELEPKYVVPDPSFRGLCRNGTPSVLAYGYAFTWERLIQYGYHTGIIKTSKPSPTILTLLLHNLCNHIQHLSGTPSKPVARNAIHTKYNIVLAVYDNYTLAKGKGVPEEDQKIILNTICRELQVPDDEGPLWYFDAEKLNGPFAT